MGRTSRAIVMAGDGTWDLRELTVPDDPPQDGAILRVEATGVCHSKVPTADLVGEVFTLDNVTEALQLVDRKIPGRDAIRVGLRLVDR